MSAVKSEQALIDSICIQHLLMLEPTAVNRVCGVMERAPAAHLQNVITVAAGSFLSQRIPGSMEENRREEAQRRQSGVPGEQNSRGRHIETSLQRRRFRAMRGGS